MAILIPIVYCEDAVIDISPNPVVANTPVTGTITIPYAGGSIAPTPYPSIDVPFTSVYTTDSTNPGLIATLRPGITPQSISTLVGGPGEFILDISGQVSQGGVNAVFQFTMYDICEITIPVAAAPPSPTVESLNCMDSVINITPTPVIPNTPVTGTVTIPYTGGNGQPYSSVVINSTYNTGLTATLVPGTLSNGAGGNLVLNITGQVSGSGLPAVFDFSFGGQNCDFAIDVPSYFPQGNQWYILYPCFNSNLSVLFTKQTEIGQYVNGTVAIYDWYNPQSIFGCYTIKAFSGTPPSYATINNNLAWDDSLCQPCQTYCVTISGGSGYVKYINNQNVETTTSLPAKICTKTKPFVSTPSPIIKLIPADCSNNCEIECYKLTNCKTGQIIHSNSAPLFTPFSGNKIVELYEYEGCWSIEIGEDCECLVEVTVKNSYVDCITCLPIIAYVLTNCENELLQKFSEEDLSPYVGKIVSLDCGDCWYVDQIDYKPPQTQEFVVENVYESCEQCSRAYFILYDCEGSLEPITTFTDMTAYLGSTLKLAGYTGCWTVQTSPTPDYMNAVGVSVTKEFEDCNACQTVTGCTCTKLKNISTVEATASYLDCAGVQQTITLDGEDSTTKICVNRWLSKNPAYFETTEFGDCVENQSTGIKECPALLNGRIVRPGYKTPAWDAEKFERITCETAEILYKQVLQLRYGISNCCPEDDDKLLVKKEILDIQALTDNDYVCSNLENCNCSNCNN